MKRLFLIIFAVGALVSCGKDNMPEDNPLQGDPIEFGKMTTRAEVNSASDILEFGVCGEMNLGEENTAGALEWSQILDNELVWQVDDSNWDYENKAYWVDKRTFFFLGVHPYTAGITRSVSDIMEGQTKTGSKITYTVPVTVPYAADSDVMTAQYTENAVKGSYPETVNLNFTHKLCKIDFKIKSDDANHTYTIKEIGLNGVSRTASLLATKNFGNDASYTESIETTTENRRVRRTGLSVTVEGTNSAVTILDKKDANGDVVFDGGLLMVPQAIVADQTKLSIAYTYMQKDNNGNVTDTRDLTLEVDIPNNNIKNWESGKSYIYSLTLKVDDNIYISTPMVEPWGSPQSGGIVIIR